MKNVNMWVYLKDGGWGSRKREDGVHEKLIFRGGGELPKKGDLP